MNFTQNFLEECELIIKSIDSNEIEKIVDILVETRKNKGRLFVIGSGGGAGHASHAVCDFRKLCNIEAYAPYDNISELTARTNDEGWDTTIVNWLRVSNLNHQDCIFVISVGGGDKEKNVSMNIVNAIQYTYDISTWNYSYTESTFNRQEHPKVVGIIGRDGGYTKKFGDAVVVIPTISQEHVTPLTEGFQAVIWHLLVSHPKLKINETKW